MKVLILCGGKGTRSYPFTEYFPKVMMPIAGTPIVVHLMRIFAQQGFTEFVLAAGHRKEILTDYFTDRFSEWNIDVVDTGDESDTGERIRRCAHLVDGTFIATYGDGLGNVDLAALVRFHHEHGQTGTVTTVPLRCQYGTLLFEGNGEVRRFLEKPIIKDCWINAGFFVFNKNVFDRWQGTNLEAHMLPALAANGELFAYRHMGFWKSMDTSKDQQEMERIHNGNGSKAPWNLQLPSAVSLAS
ncbi:MAG: NTP transferase domain-containing protein [Bryobacterales bacterium]|nr:NTP transferase domain-containing protein [Bryobacterales bacterium]